MQTAITGIMAIDLCCPDCDELVADPESGSTMLTAESMWRLGDGTRPPNSIKCVCGIRFKVPAVAGRLVGS